MSKELILNHLQDLTEKILKETKKQGATAAVVHTMQEEGFSVSVRMQETERVEYHRSKNISLTVYFGQKKASVSTSEIHQDAITDIVKKACSIAQYTQEDPCHGLPEAELMAKNMKDLDLYHPWDTTPEAAIEMALACEKQALAFDQRIVNSEGVEISTGKVYVAHGNSHGFLAVTPGTRHHAACALIAKEKGEMERDDGYTTARRYQDLKSMSELANLAAEKTIKRLGARKLTTRKVPVIFRHEISRGLIGAFLSAINGHRLYKKSSFLLDSLNQPIFPKIINIYENPFIPRGLGSSYFDGEGVATNAKKFIDQGILKSYLLDTYSARQMKLTTTGNAGGAHNLFVDATCPGGVYALCQKMGTGLLVTELMGQGINYVTGDYSRGASGFWVENGEIQYPVSEVTIAGNLKNLYANMVAVSDDVDVNSSTRVGSILLEEMMVAGA